MRALWYPAAVSRPGPTWKTSGTHRSTSWAAVYHSSEGTLQSDMRVLDGSIESSWHLYNPKTGPMLQHYTLSMITWHARDFNRESIGVENEGFAGQPLTTSQVVNLRAFTWWLWDENWINDITRSGYDQTLWQHNEVGRWKADPTYTTACPSNRIPWELITEEEEEDDEMKPFLMKTADRDEVYWTDTGSRWWVTSRELVEELKFTGVRTDPQGRPFKVRQEFIDAIPETPSDKVFVTGVFEAELS